MTEIDGSDTDAGEAEEDGSGFGDLGGIGEHAGSIYPGEDGPASLPHMPVEDEPDGGEAQPQGHRPPLDEDR
jgi:hypothetical protein